jgi:L-alanine-DL-glutamate epimerase-like enolase superfamily enzyme
MGAESIERSRGPSSAPLVDELTVDVLSIPNESEESDGTLSWHETTMVLVQARGGGESGIGYTYGAPACASVVRDTLRDAVRGVSTMDVTRCFDRMQRRVRNVGRPGIAAHAISAVDIALWDLKARLLGLSLADLLGCVRDQAPLYASGGFTSYDEGQLARQLSGWADEGFVAVKMKVGRHPERDAGRVRAARNAVGHAIDLRVDANGAYARKQALALAERFADEGVSWFEEPVSSDDRDGLAMLCRKVPPGMRISAGEYGYDLYDFQALLRAGAVDVLQVDATRCQGLTGALRAAAVAEAWSVPVSCHTAPTVHASVACAATPVLDVEWFFDHVGIERAVFDGVLEPIDGVLRVDRSRPGLGVEPKSPAIERYAS